MILLKTAKLKKRSKPVLVLVNWRSSWVVFIAVLLLSIRQVLWFEGGNPLEAIQSATINVYLNYQRKNFSSISSTPLNQKSSIPLNKNSTFVGTDVSAIFHIPSESRIEIHLQPERRCQNPVFKGRISGWSLSMIRFKKEQENVVIGTYDRFHMPVSGAYPLEIILLQCEKHPPDQSLNLFSVCLESEFDDTTCLTRRNEAVLNIQSVETPNFRNSSLKGRWLHKSLNLDNTTRNHSQALPEPIMTPIQPNWCNKYNMKELFCRIYASDRKQRFQEYRYIWDSDWEKLNQPVPIGYLQETGNKLNVCFLGDSHSRTLTEYCKDLEQVAQSSNIECNHFSRSFPEEVNNFSASRLKRWQCTHVVVGLFQWPFSHEARRRGKTISFEKFRADMTQAVKTLLQKTNSKILLWSAHPNGLGTRFTTCPPVDVRTPINAAIATEILREIADNQNITFLDTSFLIDAVWDSAPDWNHYEGEVATMEAKYILSEILKEKM